jgi:hypothetical protein
MSHVYIRMIEQTLPMDYDVAAFEGTTAFNFAAAFGGTGEVRACP